MDWNQEMLQLLWCEVKIVYLVIYCKLKLKYEILNILLDYAVTVAQIVYIDVLLPYCCCGIQLPCQYFLSFSENLSHYGSDISEWSLIRKIAKKIETTNTLNWCHIVKETARATVTHINSFFCGD
jgi:hypothetical protein